MDTAPIHDLGLDGKPLVPHLKGELVKKFLHPPFSVLNARTGEWQTRKRAWLNLGIRSELGRGANVLGHSAQSGNIDFYALKRDLEKELKRTLTTPEAQRLLRERGLIGDLTDDVAGGASPPARKGKKPTGRAFNIGLGGSEENNWALEDEHGSGTSIFDPVLCELIYSWFTAPSHQVIDPFAGGSVRGLVAGALGRRYWGCDLSAPQIAANRAQTGLLPPGAPVPEWVIGDSYEQLDGAPEADAIISCPPYFDLEVYSEDARDLSTMTWDEFRSMYNAIIEKCAARLRPDRFAVFVTGDVRDPKSGLYRDLPGLTAACFKRAGLSLYNTMILVTAVGSLSIRTERQFTVSRKLGCTHQVVQVYVKGDPVRATDAATGLTLAERRARLENQAEARKSAVSNWE